MSLKGRSHDLVVPRIGNTLVTWIQLISSYSKVQESESLAHTFCPVFLRGAIYSPERFWEKISLIMDFTSNFWTQCVSLFVTYCFRHIIYGSSFVYDKIIISENWKSSSYWTIITKKVASEEMTKDAASVFTQRRK